MDESCDVLIERLSEELAIIKEHLAAKTHGLELKLASSSLQLCPVTPSSGEVSLTSTSSLESLARVPIQKKKSKESKTLHASPIHQESKTKTLKTKEMLQIVDDREKEREELCKKRLNLMKHHIEEQLKELKMKDSFLNKIREQRLRKERTSKIQRKPKHFRSTGEDDTRYMLKMYKGTMYQAMSLEHSLKRTGQLNKPSDVSSFWDHMLNKETLTPEAMTGTSPHPSKLLKNLEEEETVNKSHGGYTNSWAITAQPPDEERDFSSSSKSSQASSTEFTYEKLPKLKPIQEILGDPIKKRFKIKRKDNAKWEGEIKTQHLQIKMAYQQSKANEMFMKTHFSSMLNKIERSLSPLPPESDTNLQRISVMETNSEVSLTLPSSLASGSDDSSVPAIQEEKTVVLSTEPLKEKDLTLNHRDKSATPNERKHLEEVEGSDKNINLSKAELVNPILEEKLAPLSMSALMKTGKTVAVKTKTTMWKNYILAEST